MIFLLRDLQKKRTQHMTTRIATTPPAATRRSMLEPLPGGDGDGEGGGWGGGDGGDGAPRGPQSTQSLP